MLTRCDSTQVVGHPMDGFAMMRSIRTAYGWCVRHAYAYQRYIHFYLFGLLIILVSSFQARVFGYVCVKWWYWWWLIQPIIVLFCFVHLFVFVFVFPTVIVVPMHETSIGRQFGESHTKITLVQSYCKLIKPILFFCCWKNIDWLV